MVQRYKFYKELKNFPPDLSGEPELTPLFCPLNKETGLLLLGIDLEQL